MPSKWRDGGFGASRGWWGWRWRTPSPFVRPGIYSVLVHRQRVAGHEVARAPPHKELHFDVLFGAPVPCMEDEGDRARKGERKGKHKERMGNRTKHFQHICVFWHACLWVQNELLALYNACILSNYHQLRNIRPYCFSRPC